MSAFWNQFPKSSYMRRPQYTQGHSLSEQDEAACELLEWIDSIDLPSAGADETAELERRLEEIDDEPCGETLSWEVFCATFSNELEDCSFNTDVQNAVLPSISHSSRSIKKLVPLVAMLAILSLFAASQVVGLNIINVVARYTKDVFYYESEAIPNAIATKRPLREGEKGEYETVEDIIRAFGIEAPLFPTWFPKQFTLERATAIQNARGLSITITYVCGKDWVRIIVTENLDVNYPDIEKDEGNVDPYICGGVEHMLMKDMDREKAVWRNGVFGCKMEGTITRQEQKQIIDSIYVIGGK